MRPDPAGPMTAGIRPANDRRQARGNSGAAYPPRGRGSAKSRPRGLFGQGPNRQFDQQGMTMLFEEQKLLNAALRRQARLLKTGVSEVVSVQAERLRQINHLLVADAVSPGMENPFARRSLTRGQAMLDDALGRQGTRFSEGSPRNLLSGLRVLPNRHHTNQAVAVKPRQSSPTELFALAGPLARDFSRYKNKGYRGSPAQWLAGPIAARLIVKLLRKGFIESPRKGKYSVFDRDSPLHWVVSGCSATLKTSLRHGFYGERLHHEVADSAVLVRQARAVTRLPEKHWPLTKSGGQAWPTFPTLNESWEMLLRGKVPAPAYRLCLDKIPNAKRPTSQVKPGASARAAATYIIGIRAKVAVPGKYLAWFRYRWGFLILRRHCPLPLGLVRFLTNQWKSDITRMFLVYPIRYNDALRLIPDDKFYLSWGFVAERKTSGSGKERWSLRGQRRSRNRQNESQDFPDDSTTTSNESGHGLRLC